MTSQIMVFTKQTATVMNIKTAIKNCKRAGNFRFAEGLEAAAKAAMDKAATPEIDLYDVTFTQKYDATTKVYSLGLK